MKTNSGCRADKKNPKTRIIDLVPAYLKLKRILVPIDFSKTSKKALDYAIPFARQFGAKITLIHAVEPYLYPVEPEFAALVVDNRALVKALQSKLEHLAEQLVPKLLLEKIIVRCGKSHREITETARKIKADMIVLTTHGHTGLQHLFLGSTAEQVVRHAPCPVFTVREREHEFVKLHFKK